MYGEHIYADAFLPPWTPQGRVPNPDPGARLLSNLPDVQMPPTTEVYGYHEFSTDNRNTALNGAPWNGGSARQWSYVQIDLCSQNPEVKKAHGVGESHGFRYVWKDKKLTEVEDKQTASDEGMTETIRKVGDLTIVDIKAATAIPFVAASPTIDYTYEIWLRLKGSKVSYHIEGGLDGFPGYSVFIGDTLVCFHTPKKLEGQNPLSPFNAGQSLASLFPPLDFTAQEICNYATGETNGNGEISLDGAYSPAAS
jgi:hypothetical protein